MRPGRIRTTAGYPAGQGWVATPDLSGPFLNSLLGRLPGQLKDGAASGCVHRVVDDLAGTQ